MGHKSSKHVDEVTDPVEKFRRDALKTQNAYRELHGAPPLRFSNKLDEHAQEWANHIAEMGMAKQRKEIPYGENVAWMWSESGQDEFTGKAAVDKFYSDVTKYDFQKGASIDGQSAKNFTQLVWKSSTEVGIGYAINPKDPKDMYAVFNYYPAGNIPGDFKANVKQPRQKKK
ncbi:Golgi-associated plant pathogenesis-related protein 1-like [Saccoglossus kowalevskii]|uniref:Cell wall protein PRY3-like n=1 Tax=Saccoglossus kowalevskii TaxID=10224 RepID=A0ABM0MPW1_SACKO|nr:PREDICTED: cell wall protein PRY3-like [Saccoglossus kowalevskii]